MHGFFASRCMFALCGRCGIGGGNLDLGMKRLRVFTGGMAAAGWWGGKEGPPAASVPSTDQRYTYTSLA